MLPRSFADAKKRPPDKGGSKVAPADDCKASAPEDGADIVLEPTKRVLDVALVGWNARVGPLCREIDRHVGAGSRVLILSEKRLEERRVLLEEEGLALDGSKLAIVEEPGLANATLEHLVRGSTATVGWNSQVRLCGGMFYLVDRNAHTKKWYQVKRLPHEPREQGTVDYWVFPYDACILIKY